MRPQLRPIGLVTLCSLLLAPLAGGALIGGSVEPLIAPTASVTPGSGGYDPNAGTGSHLIGHFKVSSGPTVLLFTIENEDGDTALDIRLFGSRLEAGDAAGPHSGWVHVSSIDSSWHRLDVVLAGSSATLTVDQAVGATVATLAPAPTGRLIETATSFVQYALMRHDAAAAGANDVFTSLDASKGWTAVGPAERFVLGPTSSGGYRSKGFLRIEPEFPHEPSAAFLATSVEGFAGTYVAELAAAVDQRFTPPVDVALIAGTRGTLAAPIIEWEVRFVRDPETPSGYRLLFVGPDGAAAYLTTPQTVSGTYHHIRAVVDEPGGRLAFTIDGGATASVIEPVGGLAASTWIAFGDVRADPLPVRDAVFGNAHFDDAIVVDVP